MDRKTIVERHNPNLQAADPYGSLSVGNGGFAFTVDVTGLQTFPEFYTDGIDLGTMAEWGWHSTPNPNGYSLTDALEPYDVHGRTVLFPSKKGTAGEDIKWLRSNPHRLGLGRIGFEFKDADGSTTSIDDIKAINQSLDLWNGIILSRFEIDNTPVTVKTCVHPDEDMISISVESPLLRRGILAVSFKFAGAAPKFFSDGYDWDCPEAHQTKPLRTTSCQTEIERTLDDETYYATISHSDGDSLNSSDVHSYLLTPDPSSDSFDFSVSFSPTRRETSLPRVTVIETQKSCSTYWNNFWKTGAAIDFSNATDPRAPELERRIVLSQYLMAIQCAGDLPPQETGLTFNSWFGKFHLEMHWWHGVHFALWNRLPLLEKTLAWYESILPAARGTAEGQGYAGVRWPKMVGPDGRKSSHPITALLIWQQPHPIYYAELCYREHPDEATLKAYQKIVEMTADFMADYAHKNPETGHYDLGPPLVPAQEQGAIPTEMCNPTFEVQYWAWGLSTAQSWRERMGLERVAAWDEVLNNLAPLPHNDEHYLTSQDMFLINDHPSLLAAYGLLPGSMVDREMMSRTLQKVCDTWNWEKTWGWDFSMIAMTATRLGESEQAIDALLKEVPKNNYSVNGHNPQGEQLSVYLPGNGSLLAAIAMMAGGWDDAPEGVRAPGFPKNGKWDVEVEGFCRMP